MCKMVSLGDGKYIAEIKQKYILNISEQANKCKNISRIILFGSSLEDRCTNESDIDIAVFGKKAKGRYMASKEYRDFRNNLFKYDFDQDYDILYFEDGKKYKDQIMKDILKGIELYRKV